MLYQRCVPILVAASVLALPSRAHASLFEGETLDTVADVMSWIVIVLAPAIAITVFWLVHILPEKIAEKKHHPQAKAIQVLCLLSLFFGGLLWPLAWLWAYTKPVLYKMAYGTDVAEPHDSGASSGPKSSGPKRSKEDPELARLRAKVAVLEAQLKSSPPAERA